MEKYDFIKCMNLHKKLKERIKGGIFISANREKLYVNINAGKGIKYRIAVNDIPDKNSIDKYANAIVDDYKAFINEKYFITNYNEFIN